MSKILSVFACILLVLGLSGCGSKAEANPALAEPTPAWDWWHPYNSAKRKVVDAAKDLKDGVEERVQEALRLTKLWMVYWCVAVPAAGIILLVITLSYFKNATVRRLLKKDGPEGKEWGVYTPPIRRVWGHVVALGVWIVALVAATWLMIF